MLRRIKRRIGRATYAKLFPMRNTGRLFPRIESCARIEEGIAMMELMERLVVLPPEASVQSQFRCQLDVILEEKGIRPSARGDKLGLHLDATLVHYPKQEVREGIARHGSGEMEIPDHVIRLVVVNRIVVGLTSHLQAVSAH